MPPFLRCLGVVGALAFLFVGCSDSSDEANGGPSANGGTKGGDAGGHDTTPEGTDGPGGDDGSGGDGGTGGDAGAPKDPVVGPRPVPSTDLAKGTIFAAPNGSGTACTEQAPCSLPTAINASSAGSVVFLRGGVYSVTSDVRFSRSGTKASPIVYESYPGERAIIDGQGVAPPNDLRVRVTGSFIVLRNIDVRNFPRQGIWMDGNDNLIEGVRAHHNKLSGIHIFSPYDDFPYGNKGSRNTIRDSIVHDNSGVGIGGSEYDDGGNSDGISISSGTDNRVEYTLAYRNSDDGIDTWRSTNSYVGHCISWGNGLGSGNGQGFKAGGAAPSEGTVVERSIAYKNKAAGFDQNSGKKVTFRYVTSFDNFRSFRLGDDTLVTKSIAALGGASNISGTGDQVDNSWQRPGTPMFLSTDPESPDFAVPVPGSGFEDIGAFGGL